MLEGYISSREQAEKWGLTIKYMQTLCRLGLIEGAVKHNGRWYIPIGAERPKDGRVITGKYVDWRKKYHVDSKIDKELKHMIDDVHQNATKHCTRQDKLRLLAYIKKTKNK